MLGKFKLVSMDVFGTLLDIQEVKESFWKVALRDRLSADAASQLKVHCDQLLFKKFGSLPDAGGEFLTTRAIFETCMREAFTRFGLDIDPVEATRTYIDCFLIAAPPYAETSQFLDSISKKLPLCLSCDGDNDMLLGPRRLHAFQHVFTSEDLRAYKLYGDGNFFIKVVERSGIKPAEIIHIGDAPAEILGAMKAGVVGCWLNRTKQEWPYSVKPDFQVSSLAEAGRVLETGVGDG